MKSTDDQITSDAYTLGADDREAGRPRRSPKEIAREYDDDWYTIYDAYLNGYKGSHERRT